ncbi:MAG: alpha/beta hydrolase [Anaerolineales bacterium]|nr:alpha/beta hydrolase [Anaerolineales bacterium]
MKIVKRVLLGLLIATVILTAGFIFWASATAQPTDVASQALQSDAQVVVTQQTGFVTFSPAGVSPTTGFIFYPGGRVDYRAYAPVLHKIAANGYFVAVVEVNLNLAFFEVEAADRVIAKYPEITHWAVGGHSLGGVAASLYAAKHQDVIKGLAFWASYPSDDSLKASAIHVISIYGTNDGLATSEKIEASKALLPPQTQYVPIEGGNHGQFGAYGVQDGDNPASVSAEEQWAQTADAISKFLESLTK